MSMDTIDDFAFFGLGVRRNGETWACGSGIGFGGWRARRSGSDRFGMGRVSGGWIHECDGGGAKLCLGRDDFDGAVEDVDGGRGGRHAAVVWRCCRR